MDVSRAVVAALGAAALAGCADSASGTGAGDVGGSGGTAVPATPLTVRDALARGAGVPLLIQGAIIAEGGAVRLCDTLMETYPPRCGGPSIRVVGLDLDALEPSLEREGDVRWGERRRVLGTIEHGVLVVRPTER